MPGRSRHRDVRNAAVVLAAEVAGKLSTFAFTVVAARELGRDEFGAFNYALAFALLAATVPSWGFNAVLVREASREPARLPELLAEALAWRTALLVPTLVVAGALGAASRPSSAATATLVLVLAAAALDLYADTARAAASVTGRLGGWAVGLILNRVLSAAVSAGLVIAGFGVVAAAAGYLLGSVVGASVALGAVVRQGVRPRRALVSATGLRSMGRASLALGLDTLVATALFRLDTLVLGAVKGDGAVADYSTAFRLVEAVLFVTWSLNVVTLPRASAARDTAEVRRVTETAVAAAGALFVPFAVVLLLRGPEVIALLFGSQYESAASAAVRWLSVAPLLFAIGYFASAALVSRDRNGPVLAASSGAAAFNLVANLAVIPRFGVAGAAAVTTCSYALESVVLLLLCLRHTGVPRLDRALAVPVLAALPTAAVLVAVDAPVAVGAVAAGAVYLAAWSALVRRAHPEVLEMLTAALRRGRQGNA